MQSHAKLFAIYVAKCFAGVLLTFTLEPKLGPDFCLWYLVSVVLVLSPRGKDALQLATARIEANLVGSTAAMVLLLAGPANLWTVAAAFSVAIASCGVFKIMSVSRSALAAVAIVMFHPAPGGPWIAGGMRAAAVVGGCASGWCITLAFHGLAPKVMAGVPNLFEGGD